MTDKEKIEIDGVDITSCCHRENNLCSCPHYKKECAKNPNCHFKIVERQRKKIDKFYRKELELCQQLARKTQECEELKRKVELMMDCPDCKVDEYKKALEEIEKYTIKQFCENCDDFNTTEYNSHCEYCEYYEYFDIINKAKGE